MSSPRPSLAVAVVFAAAGLASCFALGFSAITYLLNRFGGNQP